MKVHYGEGVANRTGPESCAAYREVCGEALTGEHIGQPLSRDRKTVPDADAVSCAEGNTVRRVTRASRRSGVVIEPGMYGRSLRGNREISGSTTRIRRVARIGKAQRRNPMMHEPEKSDSSIVAAKPANESDRVG